MQIAIVAAMHEEVIILKNSITDLKIDTFLGTQFYRGKINGCNVVLLQSGIGKVASASSTTLLLNNYQIDAVINTGSAAGIASGLNACDIVVSTNCVYYDVDLTAFGYKLGQMAACPACFDANPKLQQLACQKIKESNQNYAQGVIATGDKFVSDKNTLAYIKESFADAVAVEMEAAAIAHVCTLYKVPFVVVRAISDNGDSNAAISFDEFLALAAKASSQIVQLMLSQIQKTDFKLE